MNTSKNALKLIYQQAVRKSSSNPVTSRYGSLKTKQVHFGIEEGNPVHHKMGVFDRLLTQTTWICAVGGATCGVVTFVKLVLGKKE